MKVSLLFLSVLMLSACRSDIDTKQLSETEKGIALKVRAAVASEEFELLAFSGRRTVIPGLEQYDVEALTSQCGIKYVENSGDVIRGQQQKSDRSALYERTSKYNIMMYQYCTNK